MAQKQDCRPIVLSHFALSLQLPLLSSSIYHQYKTLLTHYLKPHLQLSGRDTMHYLAF